MTNDKVTHAGDSGFRNADLAAEVLDFLGIIGDRIDAYVVRDRLLGMFSFLKSAILRVVGTAGVDVPVIVRARDWINLPAKQVAVKHLSALRVVRRNSKPHDACCLFLL